MADPKEHPTANSHDEEIDEHDDMERRPRRRPRSNRREPAVYVGNIPRNTRVSEFKQEVRGRDVAPLRVLWKGANRHAFLFFEQEDDIEDALTKLENLSLQGQEVKVERSLERERSDRPPRRPRDDNRAPKGNFRNARPQGRRNQGSPRRGRQAPRAPTVFVGGIPKGTRVSDLKAMVRNQGVDPLRVLWRGGAGYTFLFFEHEDDAEAAITKLHDLEVNGKNLRVERGGRRPSESQDDDANHDSGSENYHDAKSTPPKQRRQAGNNKRKNSFRGERYPAIYVGGIPKGTRASEFKALIRSKDLANFRLIWRLTAGHAYLLFQKEEEVDHALNKLADLEVGGKMVRVERSVRDNSRGGNSDQENEA